MSTYIHTLLATLGGQPQVVTFTLDLLLQRGFPISEVIVIHPQAAHPRLQHSLDRLNAEFDTITTKRIYRANPLTPVDAIRNINERSGSWYDPAVVDALRAHYS